MWAKIVIVVGGKLIIIRAALFDNTTTEFIKCATHKIFGFAFRYFFSRWKGVTALVEVSKFQGTAQIQQCHLQLTRVRRYYSSKNNEVWQVLGLGKEEKLRRVTCKSTFFAGIPTSRIDQWIESNFYGTEELCRIYKAKLLKKFQRMLDNWNCKLQKQLEIRSSYTCS